MLSYGCTRLEIGLQSIYEDVARDTNRGHTVAAVGECFRLAKDAGFKVGATPLSERLLSILLSDWLASMLPARMTHTCASGLLSGGEHSGKSNAVLPWAGGHDDEVA